MQNLLLVVNYGGPQKGKEREYLKRLFSDPVLFPFPAPLRWILGNLVALLRRGETAEILSAVGGTSPFLKQTFEQAKALGKLLEGWEVGVAMRYSDPLLEEVLRNIAPERFENIVLLPLFPQYSVATWGSVERVVEKSPLKGKVKFAKPFYGCENFILGWVEAIEKTLKGLEKPFLLFSAHSLPLYLVRKYGDPYPKQVEESAKLIAQRLELPYKVSYQSRLGPIRWLEPTTEEALKKLRKDGVKELVVIPISFVSENTETLQEIDLNYRQLAENLGYHSFRRVKIPHLHPEWLECWKELALATIRT
ncbi:MAG TPA: ferrochelatase [Aquificales bacterium]|nr:ferrochelatase [Aquificales bacterium]